ncbi:UNVERIFIED_CONTAM: 30S ribosomal protein S5, chloroplastic [Sesamum angustifolium]|uniref:30S ribosomal protein S5, chloroplastic n=1 Tax=Sesamum angustifolium TaxID=2727405 RepID=A0AAW2INI3_9LAMI
MAAPRRFPLRHFLLHLPQYPPPQALSFPLSPPFLLHLKASLPVEINPNSSCQTNANLDTTFFDTVDPEEISAFSPPEPPEDFIPPPSFDEGPLESEDDIARAYEEIYGPAYSGETLLGNDVYVMDSKVKKTTGFGSKNKKEKGNVGVGKAKEVIAAVQKSAINARRNIVTVPMTKYKTFPHRSDADYGPRGDADRLPLVRVLLLEEPLGLYWKWLVLRMLLGSSSVATTLNARPLLLPRDEAVQ